MSHHVKVLNSNRHILRCTSKLISTVNTINISFTIFKSNLYMHRTSQACLININHMIFYICFLILLMLSLINAFTGIKLITQQAFSQKKCLAIQRIYLRFGTQNINDISDNRILDSALNFLQNGESLSDSAISEDDWALQELYDDSAKFDIPYNLIHDIERNEAVILANKAPSAANKNKAAVNEAIQKWRRHQTDVGSPEVQIAITNERIKYLTTHLLKNKKDISSKRGLQALVVLRRKFLAFLSRTNAQKARMMAEELGIRFQITEHKWNKQTKYGAFTNTKSRIAHKGIRKRLSTSTR